MEGKFIRKGAVYLRLIPVHPRTINAVVVGESGASFSMIESSGCDDLAVSWQASVRGLNELACRRPNYTAEPCSPT